MAVQADIANVEAKRVREAVKKVRPSKKDLQQLGKGNLAGVITGKGTLDEMQGHDEERKLLIQRRQRRQR